MTMLSTRFVCVLLSTLGAAGLVVFADPANAVGSASPKAPVTVATTTAAASIAHRG